MKMCHSEVMKYIKDLENKKNTLLLQERNRCTFNYVDEKNKIVPRYSYDQTREQVDRLDSKIRILRHQLAVANTIVKVEEFDITIGEALVLLSQLQNKYNIIEALSMRQQITQTVVHNGSMQFVECNYDVEKTIADCEKLRAEIHRLQIAIDRANLTNYVEVTI